MEENLPVPCVCIFFVLNHEKCSLPKEHVCTIFVINLRIIFPFPHANTVVYTEHIVISETHFCFSFLVLSPQKRHILILCNTFTHFIHEEKAGIFRGFPLCVCVGTISISVSVQGKINIISILCTVSCI